jgi:putative flippase GtrA
MTQINLKKVSVVSNPSEPDHVVLEPQIEGAPVSIAHTYYPTHWPFVNHVLDAADSISHGRAGQMQRLISFLFIGGLASLVNLGVLSLVYYHSLQSLNDVVHHAIAFLLASEIAILVNFSLNDYFTFRHLSGHARSWGVRCARFHLTSFSGVLLTSLISFSLNYGLHISFVLAQAIAILIVLFYNFTAHHLFTYRRLKTTTAH